MGMLVVKIQVSAMDGGEAKEVEAIVDTGSAYTMLPGSWLRELGVAPIGTRPLDLADGRRVLMNYGRAWVTVGGESEVTLVVFGEDDGPALLGAYTLEGLALAVDPVKQRLVPTALIMYRLAG
ncbi:MAG: aspartyl protease family protein [bacterium]|nr:aspartyl protease family protein [bacterium]